MDEDIVTAVVSASLIEVMSLDDGARVRTLGVDYFFVGKERIKVFGQRARMEAFADTCEVGIGDACPPWYSRSGRAAAAKIRAALGNGR